MTEKYVYILEWKAGSIKNVAYFSSKENAVIAFGVIMKDHNLPHDHHWFPLPSNAGIDHLWGKNDVRSPDGELLYDINIYTVLMDSKEYFNV